MNYTYQELEMLKKKSEFVTSCLHLSNKFRTAQTWKTTFENGKAIFIDLLTNRRNLESTVFVSTTVGSFTFYSNHCAFSIPDAYCYAFHDLKNKIEKVCEMRLEDITEEMMTELTTKPKNHTMTDLVQIN